MSFQPKKVSHKLTEWGLSCEGEGGGVCRSHFRDYWYTFSLTYNHNSNWVWLVKLSLKKVSYKLTEWGLFRVGGREGLQKSLKVSKGWVKSGRCKSCSWHKRKNLQILNLQILTSLLILLLINYNHRLSHKLIFIFSLRSQLIFIGIRVMRPSRKEISSMLFIFTLKELKWTAMRKNWGSNCTTTGLLHILNLVRWWEL